MNIEFTDEEILTVLRELGYKIEIDNSKSFSRRRKFLRMGDKSYIIINEKKYTIYEVFKKELLKSISKNKT